jgi:hypothetical protein
MIHVGSVAAIKKTDTKPVAFCLSGEKDLARERNRLLKLESSG